MSRIFVFGANEAGIHGAGAARFAADQLGAIYGQGYGLQGLSFGIPTKDHYIRTLPLNSIKEYVEKFLAFAREHPEMKFDVTRIGCGLAGFTNEDMAPLFIGAPDNCYFPKEWVSFGFKKFHDLRG